MFLENVKVLFLDDKLESTDLSLLERKINFENSLSRKNETLDFKNTINLAFNAAKDRKIHKSCSILL